jgi:isopropylmalate/homocitrate/citramalate synthase
MAITKPDASLVWVSELNAAPEVRRDFAGRGPVRFYDATLRDGEQTVGVVLSPQQKLEIARQLDNLGVARIEAGFPRVSEEDAEAITLIQRAGLKAEVWGFSRAVAADIDELLRLGVQYSVIEAPTSAIKLQAYGMQPAQIIERVVTAVKHATKAGVHVAFFAVDGTRTELAFLREVYSRALEAGAKELVVVDTIGACGPEAAAALVGHVREWAGKDVPLHWHGHNDFGLATASAIAAVRAGAEWIQGTINGMGERAGNADIGEIALALACLYGVPVEMDLPKLRTVSGVVQRNSRYELEPWKPGIGENLFVRESGAVASQFHIPEAIEPYAAEIVGATRGIVLGKKSGLDSVDLKCRELGLTLPAELRAPVLAEVKRRSIANARLVSDQEFRAIVSSATATSAPAATR